MAILRSLMAIATMASMVDLAVGENYIVGAPEGGWDLITNYTLWASNKIFFPGDTLTFLYGSSHDVVEVTSSGYGSCTVPSNPIWSDKSGNTSVTLKDAGTTRYFICGTPQHCKNGMKLAINVALLSASSPTPSSSPSPLPDFPPADGPAADSILPLPPPFFLSPPAPTGAAGCLGHTRAKISAVAAGLGVTMLMLLAI